MNVSSYTDSDTSEGEMSAEPNNDSVPHWTTYNRAGGDILQMVDSDVSFDGMHKTSLGYIRRLTTNIGTGAYDFTHRAAESAFSRRDTDVGLGTLPSAATPQDSGHAVLKVETVLEAENVRTIPWQDSAEKYSRPAYRTQNTVAHLESSRMSGHIYTADRTEELGQLLSPAAAATAMEYAGSLSTTPARHHSSSEQSGLHGDRSAGNFVLDA